MKIWADATKANASESGAVLIASGKADWEAFATVHSAFNFLGVTLSGPILTALVVF